MINITKSSLSIPRFRLLIISLFFTGWVAAQETAVQQLWLDESQVDSIRFHAINEYCTKHAYAQPDSIFDLANYFYELAKQKNATKAMAMAIDKRALVFWVKGEYDDALDEMKKIADLLLSINDTISLAATYSNIGAAYGSRGKYQDGIKYLGKSLALYEMKGTELNQADVLNNLCSTYESINSFDLALEYCNKALALYEKIELEKETYSTWLNLGSINIEKGNYRQAIANGQKAVDILLSLDKEFNTADSYHMIAKSYQALNILDTALLFVNKSLAINETIGNDNKIAKNKILKGHLMFENDVNKATKIGEEVLEIIDRTYSYSQKVGVYKLLHKCYKAKGNLPLALSMHEKYISYYDSLLIEKDNLALTRAAIQSEYEAMLFDQQIENERTQSQLKLYQLKRTFAILLVSLLTILLLFYYFRSRILAQRKEKEALLKEIKDLKAMSNSSINLPSQGFQLDRTKIEGSIDRKMNETDWKVLNILLDDPVISNKDIAQKAFLTVDGIGSCLRRMYVAFDVKESKYKKISLLMKAIKLSSI